VSFDIIGDIHGYCDKLEALLTQLGYRERAGAWRHADRQAIFVGDFIDRGPAEVRSVTTVRRMVDAGSALAVMGNHELNAIAWHTPDPGNPGDYLRPHFSPEWGLKNRHQHAAFLAEVEDKPALHTELVDWFLSLPLWLEVQGLRVVHACWHAPFMAWVSPYLDRTRYLTRELMVAATDEPSDEREKDDATPSVFKAVETMTKGIEVPLPIGFHFFDKDSIMRTRVRVRWWDTDAATYRTAAMLSPAERDMLPDVAIPPHVRLPAVDKPVFFGHYWLSGTPSLQAPLCACVDYSAGKGGPLVAYRFDGQPTLCSADFVSVG
jgi:hypothetical protein